MASNHCWGTCQISEQYNSLSHYSGFKMGFSDKTSYGYYGVNIIWNRKQNFMLIQTQTLQVVIL